MRSVFIALIAGVVALAAGFAAAAQFYQGKLAEADSARLQAEHRARQAEADASAAAPDLEAARAQVERLQSDYASCVSQSQELQQRMASLAAAPAPQPEVAAPAGDEVDAMLDAAPEPGAAAEGTSPRPDRPARQDAPNDRGWDDPQRQERMQEFQQRMDDFFATEIANAPDNATAERLQQIDAYRRQMAELRTAMRGAKTEEERQALEDQLDEARQGLQQSMHAQQRAMIGDVGRSYGIKGEDLRNFQQDMRNTMESPYFMFGSGRGFGRGGGWRPQPNGGAQ